MNLLYLDMSDLRLCKEEPEKLRLVRTWMEANNFVLGLSPLHMIELEQGGHESAVKDVQNLLDQFGTVYLLPSIDDVVSTQLDEAKNPRGSYPVELVDLRQFGDAEAIVREGLERASFLRGRILAFAVFHASLRVIGISYNDNWSAVASRSTWKEAWTALSTPNLDVVPKTDAELEALIRRLLRFKRADPRVGMLREQLREQFSRAAKQSGFSRGLVALVSISMSRAFMRAADHYVGGFAECDAAILGFKYLANHWLKTGETPATFFRKYSGWHSLPLGLVTHTRAARLRNVEHKVAPGSVLDELHLLYAAPGSRMTLDAACLEYTRQALNARGLRHQYDCFIANKIQDAAWL